MTRLKSQHNLYTELAGQYGPMMVRLARVNEADAEHRRDLLQDMHLALWRSLPNFRGECAMSTWVYRVAHNACVDHIRREGRRKVNLKTVNEWTEAEASIPKAPSLSETIQRRDALDKLNGWIAALDMPDRMVATLYLEGLSAKDISEVSGLGSGAVATRISRLKSALTRDFAKPATSTAHEVQP